MKPHPHRHNRGMLGIFGAPIVLATLCALGLIVALVGDGLWHLVSWLSLATPICVIAWCARPR